MTIPTGDELKQEESWNAIPEHGWTCFHCGETFTTVGSARDHFGGMPDKQPGCMIRVQLGDERGLQMALRTAEDEIERLRLDVDNETTNIQQFYNQLRSVIAGYTAFKDCRTIQDIFNLYDSLEGEKIALAEKNEQLRQQLTEAQKIIVSARDTMKLCPDDFKSQEKNKIAENTFYILDNYMYANKLGSYAVINRSGEINEGIS